MVIGALTHHVEHVVVSLTCSLITGTLVRAECYSETGGSGPRHGRIHPRRDVTLG